MDESDWPYSVQEMAAAKKKLYPSISFIDVIKSYSSMIEPCSHFDFTHKCSCPYHNGGRERTPSFYFSVKTKNFHCFGCSLHGDIFDLISVMEGKPAAFIVRDMMKNMDLTVTSKDLLDYENNIVSYDRLFEINFDLSQTISNYLRSRKGTDKYKEEEQWVDWMFRRIDDRFDGVDDSSYEEIMMFKMQIALEVKRRSRL